MYVKKRGGWLACERIEMVAMVACDSGRCGNGRVDVLVKGLERDELDHRKEQSSLDIGCDSRLRRQSLKTLARIRK
ncbi:hypothetical protein Hanom_Chr03g00264321 [Helianthus anomalus]